MLSDLFFRFARNYHLLTQQRFGSNTDTDLIKIDIPNEIIKLASVPSSYKVYGTVGQGQWAEIPWVAVLDKSITESTQRGYYIVFLYNADLSGVYLSLAIGWEQYEQAYGIKEGRNKIEGTVKKLQQILRSPLNDFSFEKRSLNAKNTLGKGYESGGICHKFYKIDSLPNDSVIVNDLRNLMGVYRELKGIVGTDILNLELPEEMIEDESFKKKVIKESEKISTPSEAKDAIEELTKFINESPAPVRSKMASYVVRNQKLSRLIKQAANWYCEICGGAPFKKRDGSWYAEAHHTLELAQNRIDLPKVMMCVCAQCHRILTYGTDGELEKRKQMKASVGLNP